MAGQKPLGNVDAGQEKEYLTPVDCYVLVDVANVKQTKPNPPVAISCQNEFDISLQHLLRGRSEVRRLIDLSCLLRVHTVPFLPYL